MTYVSDSSVNMASDAQSLSSGSDSGSTPEEERIRRLFQTCDGNGDGYIDSQDLMAICCQLNLEHCVEEIMEQLGADEDGRISYDEFLRRRMQLMNEINALTLEEQQAQGDNEEQTSLAAGSSSQGNWAGNSNASLGAMSAGNQESWEFDSGARDLSPEPNFLQRLTELVPNASGELLNQANKLHVSILAAVRQEAWQSSERRWAGRWQAERMRATRDRESRLHRQAQRYEHQLTELHSVIAELSRKLDLQTAAVIKEEDESSQQSGDESRMSETPSQSSSERGELTEKPRAPPAQESDDNRPQEGSSQQDEVHELQERLARKEADLNIARAALASAREDRDRLYRKVKELQNKVQQSSGFHSASSQGSQTGSSPSHGPPTSLDEPPPRLAERVRLRTLADDLDSQQPFDDFPVSTPATATVEFEVELERVQSRVEHLRSQNDLLTLALEESRSHCDRLSVLLAKCESNTTALQMALARSDQALEAAEVLLALLETEQGLILANCHAAGLGALTGESEEEAVTAVLHRATANRHTAESVAYHCLRVLESSGYATGSSSTSSPWEDLSSSRTTSTSSSSSSLECGAAGAEFGKAEEQRMREHITRLKAERNAVCGTVVELESLHLDPPPALTNLAPPALDLENAVLVQELMATKEEKAELRARLYLLEKEKTGLQLQLSTREAQLQAQLLQIQLLRASQGEASDERQVQEVISTLEQVTHQSELRAQQSSELVEDLKRANSALTNMLDKSKRKHLAKVRKLESQMAAMVDRNSTQIQLLKQRIAMLEGDTLGANDP